MAIIGEALRQAFMQKNEYDALREEDRVWIRLQRPLLICSLAVVILAIVISTVISLKIVFPGNSAKRPFCGDPRLQMLSVTSAKGGDSDLFPGAFYLTDQETADYYWMVVFFPSTLIFLASAVYLLAG